MPFSAEHVLLVGMMGAGKTTVGERLARALGRVHLDSDAQVESATGRTVPEILESDGEAAFRIEETNALRGAIARPEPAVISIAGGAVLAESNRRALEDAGLVVWLRADIETLAARVGSGEGRPLLGDDPEGNLRRLYETRRGLYEEVADLTVDVDHTAPDAVVERILAALATAEQR